MKTAPLAFLLLACETCPYGGPIMVPVGTEEAGPPGSCEALGSVDGASTGRRLPRARAEIEATHWLREAAADLGGNYVRVERFTWNAAGSKGWRGSAHGTAYRCNVEARRTEVLCSREDGLSTCSVE